MAQVLEFNKALEAFKKATKPFDPSESFKGFQNSTKAVVQAATVMDQVAGKTFAQMNEALSSYESVLNIWLEKLEKQVPKEKKAALLKPEVTKFQRQLLIHSQAYKKDAEKLQEQKVQAPMQKETKETGKEVLKEVVSKANDKKLEAAIKKLKDMRAAELKANVELKEKMTQNLQLIGNLRGNAEKTLAAAELDASKGLVAEAGQKALILGKMASDAQKQATASNEYLDKSQKAFMEFRNGLNWIGAAKTFDLDAKLHEKEYGKAVTSQIPVYNKVIKLGGDSHGLVKSMVQAANEIASMAELCTAYGKDANALRGVTLKNLTESSGSTSRASFDEAISGDEKRSVVKLVEKVKSSVQSMTENIKTYMSAKDNEAKAKAKESVVATWGLLQNAKEDLDGAFERARQAFETAKSRVPKSLVNDGDVKKALTAMGTILLQNKQQMNPAIDNYSKLLKVVTQLKLDAF